jgi:hypothetical protein
MPAADRVNHFGFICTGPSGGGWLSPCYWKVHQELFSVLRGYGYPNEAIYRLSEAGEWHQPGVGLATFRNFQEVFKHMEKVAKQDDHVFIAIIGHGLHPNQPNNQTGEFAYLLLDRLVTATELAGLLSQIKASNVTIALHPCFSGGFLPKLCGTHPDRVIVTSTMAAQGNSFGWIESFTAALSIRGRKRGRSIKEVWEQTKREAADEYPRYGMQLEIPEIDNEPVAALRYLGDNGTPLEFTRDALGQLRIDNATLHLACRPGQE